jgi:DNA-binding transcriptional LysR family regulator
LILAEELNYTRAAERLKITQPALSKQIIELENRLGFSVFLRDQKKVELTEPGQVFIRGCKDARALLEKSIRLARAVKEEVQPVVTIGHSPFVDPSLVSAILSVHLPLYPNLRLRMESMFALELVHSVLSAELDLAIIGEPSPNPLLTLVPLTTDPLYVVVSSDHPAAKQRDVAINDLARVGWIVFPRRANPVIYDRVLEAGEKAQVKPVELHHYMASPEAVQLISENFGVAFMPKGLAEQIRHPEIITRPIRSNALQVTSHLVLRADQTSRLVNEFGRAFIRKAISNPKIAEASGQMLLKL